MAKKARKGAEATAASLAEDVAQSDAVSEPTPVQMPESFEAFTTLKVPGGHAFVKVTLDKDLKVKDIDVSNVDTWPVVQEKFKVAMGKYWMKLVRG